MRKRMINFSAALLGVATMAHDGLQPVFVQQPAEGIADESKGRGVCIC